jgi:hypothetical protein
MSVSVWKRAHARVLVIVTVTVGTVWYDIAKETSVKWNLILNWTPTRPRAGRRLRPDGVVRASCP